MTAWTSDELDGIAAEDELEIASMQDDGALTAPTTIWVARVDDDLYVRPVLAIDPAGSGEPRSDTRGGSPVAASNGT